MPAVAAYDEAILPWPECLGSFDEESCRYLLRELGQRVVQYYPFSVGMEEVFTQIVDEFGMHNAPDVLSVLHELLEDDSTASGIGDDGDIWRSWRHNWRHRNDDPHNPFVPRVRGRVLAQPTSTRIRLLKSANFLTSQLSQAKANRQSYLPQPQLAHKETHSEVYYGLNGSACKAEPLGPHANVDNGHRTMSGCAPSKCQTHDSHILSHGSHYGTTTAVEAHICSPTKLSNACVGNPPDLLRRSMPVSTRRYAFPFDLASPKRRSSTGSPDCTSNSRVQIGTLDVDTIVEEGHDLDQTLSRNVSDSCFPISATNVTINDGIMKTPVSTRLTGLVDNRSSLPSDLESTDVEATPTIRRAVHRQARVIDSALFHGKSRKGRFVESDSVRHKSPVKASALNEVSSKRLSSQSTQPSPRASWLHNVMTRFLGDHSRKSTDAKLRKRQSSQISCTIGSSQTNKTYTSTIQQRDIVRMPEMSQASPSNRLNLDGSSDARSNKPLPLSPADQGGRPSLQSDIQRNFFGRAQHFPEFSSNASCTSSGIGRTVEKDELRSLVSATMSGPQELSPKDKDLRYRFSSSTSASGLPSPYSFTTFATQKPSRNSNESTSPGLAPPPPLNYHKNELSSAIWPFRRAEEGSQMGCDDEYKPSRHNKHRTVQQVRVPGHEDPVVSGNADTRGRKQVSPTSPTKPKFGLRTLSPETPRARSRSPVKKLVGMVKSMSTNQISTHPTPPRTATPTSNNKKKWKELSHKLRHGFLTADLEQLEQEDMMEQYASNSDDAVRTIAPPTKQSRISFPVSIKSSGQSKLWSELEYMLIETCNSFLKEELKNNRLSRDSVLRAKHQWQARNRPQVIEFYYDQATQYEIIVANLRNIQLYSDYAHDAIILNSVLYQWKTLIRELSVKTLCMPDSIIRRWLHDGRRVLELLGASQITLSHLDRLSSLCFAVIGSAEKERAKARNQSGACDAHILHRRSVSDGSQTTLHVHEHNLMMAKDTPPPLPTPSSLGTASRKTTPQERRIAQDLNRTGRCTKETEKFIFKHGHGYSKSLTPAEDRSRFMFD